MASCTRLKAEEDQRMLHAADLWLQDYTILPDEAGKKKTIPTSMKNSYKRLPYAMRLLIEQYKMGMNPDEIEKMIHDAAVTAENITIKSKETDEFHMQESYDSIKMYITIGMNEMIAPLSAATGLEKKWFKLEENTELLDRLPAIMKAGIKNQDLAIDNMITVLRMNMLNENPNRKHLGSFFFYGPTGVGKTQTCKVLSQALGKTFHAINMNEHSGDTGVASLLGADAGYVGHKQWGRIGMLLKESSNALILFDEFDKVKSQSVKDIFLQILDEGTIVSKSADVTEPMYLKNCIIVFSSNIYGKEIDDIGYLKGEQKAKEINQLVFKLEEHLMKNHDFRPEFIARIDSFIMYNSFDSSMVPQILPGIIAESSVFVPGWEYMLHESILWWFIEWFYNPQAGVRGLRNKFRSLLAPRIFNVMEQIQKLIKEDASESKDENELMIVFICNNEYDTDARWLQIMKHYRRGLRLARKDNIFRVKPNPNEMMEMFNRFVRFSHNGNVYQFDTSGQMEGFYQIKYIGPFNQHGFEYPNQVKCRAEVQNKLRDKIHEILHDDVEDDDEEQDNTIEDTDKDTQQRNEFTNYIRPVGSILASSEGSYQMTKGVIDKEGQKNQIFAQQKAQSQQADFYMIVEETLTWMKFLDRNPSEEKKRFPHSKTRYFDPVTGQARKVQPEPWDVYLIPPTKSSKDSTPSPQVQGG